MPTFTNPRDPRAPDQGPDLSARKTIKSRVLTAQFGDGYTQATTAGINPHRVVWDLEFGGLTQEAAALLLAEATAAQTLPVTYKVLNDAQRVYLVTVGSLRFSNLSPEACLVAFQLQEVFGRQPDVGQTLAGALGL